MQSLSVIQIVLQALEEEGVTHIFGVPGGPLVPFYEALVTRESIKFVFSRHEEGAAFMAEGYARVRRGLGVCSVASGPGATNALTGVASAYSDSVPLLLLSAQVSSNVFGKGALQDSSSGNWNVDVVELFRSATKLSLTMQNPLQATHLIRKSLRTALTGRPGAVHLNIPADVMQQSAEINDQPATSYYSHVLPAGDKQALRSVASALQHAKMPALLVGHGVNLSGAWQHLQRLAERLSIPVATTIKGKGAFPERHPLSLGVFGFGGHPLAEEYVCSDEVDVLLVVGSSLGELQTNGWDPRLGRNRTVIQIDIDPLEIGKNYPVDVSIVGDARSVLDALANSLSFISQKQLRHTVSALEQMRAKISRYYQAEELQGSAELFKSQALVAKMNEILPDDTLVFVDNDDSLRWIGQYYEVRQTGTMFMATNVAAMGYAVAASIGGKIAAPDRPVVALLGDAAFAMNGMELHTAAEYHIPVIWIVLNNGGHGMVYNSETLIAGHSNERVFHKPLDVAMIASGLGVQSVKATNLAEFTAALRQALEAHAPFVIDALVESNQVPGVLS